MEWSSAGNFIFCNASNPQFARKIRQGCSWIIWRSEFCNCSSSSETIGVSGNWSALIIKNAKDKMRFYMQDSLQILLKFRLNVFLLKKINGIKYLNHVLGNFKAEFILQIQMCFVIELSSLISIYQTLLRAIRSSLDRYWTLCENFGIWKW